MSNRWRYEALAALCFVALAGCGPTAVPETGFALEGTVRDSRTAAPIEGAIIELAWPRNGANITENDYDFGDVSNEQGNYFFEWFGPNRPTGGFIRFRKGGFVTQVHPMSEVVPQDGRFRLDAHLDRAISFEITHSTASGPPHPDVDITLRLEELVGIGNTLEGFDMVFRRSSGRARVFWSLSASGIIAQRGSNRLEGHQTFSLRTGAGLPERPRSGDYVEASLTYTTDLGEQATVEAEAEVSTFDGSQ